MTPTHAGGVVISRRGGTAIVLLTRASKPPYDWVLPKGHIETGETPERAAEREVLEETGVEADVVKSLGDVSFEYKRRDIRVRYFLMRFRKAGVAEESREVKWCSPGQAERLLTFDNMREIVRRAATDDSS
jgi:8-oxo-dGTP pyrophosphatase MutT (NUDIX family)